MKVLGIETATRTGGVALLREKGVIAEYTSNIEVTHSERLMAHVDRLLADTGVALMDIDAFAVSIGPGSFTGLRIGIATVKGLAFTTGKPVVAVPTLKALAWNVLSAGYPVCPLLDAKKKEVYAAIYRPDDGDLAAMMRESVLPIETLAERITERTLFTGEGSAAFRGELTALLGERAVFAPLSSTVPSAASVAEIGLRQLLAGERIDLDALSPLYIRRPEAELAWERRHQSR